ncbi:MAG: DUF4234 domain-containing protein [Bacilli bacterium]|nr:DUF4234 domain-containing protein [Bacilli bacterium]
MGEETKKIIEEQKQSFLHLMKNEKTRFIFVIARIILALLFILGLLLPALRVGTVHVSISFLLKFYNLGFIFWVPFIVTILGYALMVLMRKEKIATIILLIQASLLSTAVSLCLEEFWGGVRGGLVITFGSGFYITAILLVCLWLVYFNEGVAFNLIQKFFGKSVKDDTDYSNLYVKKTSDIYEEKNIVLCVIHSIFTFGVYGIIWLYSVAKKIKFLNEGSKDIIGEFLLMIVVPFYIFFWIYKAGLRLSAGAKKHDIEVKDNGTLYLLLSILALGIVALSLSQSQLNFIAKALKAKKEPTVEGIVALEPITQESVPEETVSEESVPEETVSEESVPEEPINEKPE